MVCMYVCIVLVSVNVCVYVCMATFYICVIIFTGTIELPHLISFSLAPSE